MKNLNITGLDIKRCNSKVYKNFVIGDARKLPFPEKSFDIVFSNSVLEHIGDYKQQKLAAKEIRRVGKKYFVQVPNKNFPIEPHYFIPFLQFLPVKLQKMFTYFLFGEKEEIYLPTKRQLKILFPDGSIVEEKFLGLTKSFYVYKC